MSEGNEERFISLWNDYLEGDLDEPGIAELRSLVGRDERLLSMATDSYQIHRLLGLAAQDTPERQDAFVGETMVRLPADGSRVVEGVMRRLPGGDRERKRPLRALLIRWLAPMATAAAALALLAWGYFSTPRSEARIAEVTGLNGGLQWTGPGGRVHHDLTVGTALPGGTLEGITPGSWFELRFRDGTVVTVYGDSTLTFSDQGQIETHLKEGRLSANVRPQPAGKPMLVYTRSARLEVLGTVFDVEAEPVATTLSVKEGTVRVRRFSDGKTVDVPANHHVVAAADREMLTIPAPGAIGRWKSQLRLGPGGAHGKWSPGTDVEEAKLRTVPYTTPDGRTIYTLGFGVSRGAGPAVILRPGSRLRARGRLPSPHDVWFGVTLRHRNGGFAGRFQTIRPVAGEGAGRDFDVDLDLRDFHLDPSLQKVKSKMPKSPFDLVVETIWCHTLDENVGLTIVEVELVPPSQT